MTYTCAELKIFGVDFEYSTNIRSFYVKLKDNNDA